MSARTQYENRSGEPLIAWVVGAVALGFASRAVAMPDWLIFGVGPVFIAIGWAVARWADNEYEVVERAGRRLGLIQSDARAPAQYCDSAAATGVPCIKCEREWECMTLRQRRRWRAWACHATELLSSGPTVGQLKRLRDKLNGMGL
jgi:hypothetical protein